MRIPNTIHGFRWDPHLMRPLNKVAISAAAEFMHSLHDCASTHTHLWEHSQQVLLIDNWHVLHGRANVVETKQRCIERVLLKEINYV